MRESMASTPKNRFVGAHVSASGGADRAIVNSLALGPSATSTAFFVRPRLSWKAAAPLSEATVARFHEALSSGGVDLQQQQIRLEHVVVHGSYLINLGTHDAQLREKSVALMIEEVTKCTQLGVPLYVFHPGACTGVARAKRSASKVVECADASRSSKMARAKKRKTSASEHEAGESDDEARDEDALEANLRRQSLGFVAESVATVLDSTASTTLAVETMSGQGNVLGSSFQELRTILTDAARLSAASDARDRLGVCLDTCHVFASGWELSTEERCEAMMHAFHASMHPEWSDALKVVHVNDSRGDCGSRTDRHANIGRGKIGLTAFRWLMNAPHFANLPLILETPRAKSPKLSKAKVTKVPSDGDSLVTARTSLWTSSKDELKLEIPSAAEEIELLCSLVDHEC